MSASGTDLPVYHVTKPSDLLGLSNRLLGLSLKTIMYIHIDCKPYDENLSRNLMIKGESYLNFFFVQRWRNLELKIHTLLYERAI